MKSDKKSRALLPFKIGDVVEVSSDEKGFKGAWYPATVVEKAGVRNGFVIEYRDLREEGKRNTKLRETVKVSHIRPQPPDLNRQSFCINEVVDAYDREGWWKGVVKAIRPRSNKYVVYFQNTEEQRQFNIKHVRVHQVWTDDKWVRASDAENVELNEVNPNSPHLSTKKRVNISLKSATRSTRANKNGSETRVSKLSGECKVDEQCGNLQAECALSAKNLVNISSESTRRTTRANKNLGETRISELAGECKADEQSGNLQAVGSQLTSKSSKRKLESKDQSNYDTSCKKKCPNEKSLEVVTGVEDEEKLRESVAVGPIGDLHENLGFPAEVETMTVTMPYIEYVDQNMCSLYNTPVIRGKGTLKQIQKMAYHSVVEALYLQNNLDWNGEILLTELRDVFQISNAEHAKELKCVTSIQHN